jgi:hypothetical protein
MSRTITDYAQAASDLANMTARKDAAYLERNQCVALIARMALASGWRAGIARTAIEGWSEDWHGCVYVDLPTGQTSWHYHDSQAHLFADLPPYTGAWDGHDTPEKYRRVGAAFPGGKAAQPAQLEVLAEEPWERDDEGTFCTLLLVGDHSVPREAIAGWTDEQCQQAEEWAYREHLHASDNDDVERVPKPAHVAAHPYVQNPNGGLWD